MPAPLISIVISTFNRRAVLLNTLTRLESAGLHPREYEVLVVDNASTDDTVAAVSAAFPAVRLFPQRTNRGPVSKNIGIAQARGRYVLFLDDDSYPHPGALRRMVAHFEAEPRLGAAVFDVHLPDGSRECSAYPTVFIGCGTGFRRRALQEVGGLPDDFFMAAEEYDLSLRLMAGGWAVRRFDDLHVTHLKAPGARYPARITRLDVRNNILLIARHFPARWALPFARDWLQRYWFIAAGKGHRRAYVAGLLQGVHKWLTDCRRAPLDAPTFEQFARIEATRHRLRVAADAYALDRVVFVDLGKNIHPFYLAARAAGLEVLAIADDRLAAPGRHYRGIPILADAAARALPYDAAIVANISPVHAAERREAWRALDSRRPTIDLFELVAETLAAPELAGLSRAG